MRWFILGLLMAAPMTPYEVRQRFAAGLAHIYAASYGTIHRSLEQLLADGDVWVTTEAAGARGRRRFGPTEQGRVSWMAWMTNPTTKEDVEVAALARVFLLGLVEDPGIRSRILSALADVAGRKYDELSALAGERAIAADLPDYPGATLSYGVAASAALVAWLDGLDVATAGGVTR